MRQRDRIGQAGRAGLLAEIGHRPVGTDTRCRNTRKHGGRPGIEGRERGDGLVRYGTRVFLDGIDDSLQGDGLLDIAPGLEGIGGEQAGEDQQGKQRNARQQQQLLGETEVFQAHAFGPDEAG